MRDSVILAGQNHLEMKVAHDIRMLMQMNTLCRARIDAMEKVFFGSRWSLIKMFFLLLVSPAKVAQAVQMIHSEMIEDFNLRVERANVRDSKLEIK